jgi:hypothetical protein
MSLTTNYLKNDIPLNGFTMLGAGVHASYRLFDERVVPGAGVSVNINTPETKTSDLQLIYRVGIRFAVTESLSLNTSAVANSYSYGSAQPGGKFTEYTLQAALSYSF